MTASHIKELEVLEELYTDESPSEINLKKLSGMLGVSQKDLAAALDMSEGVLSKKPYAPHNQTLKQWQLIFNLIIKIVSSSEPLLSATEVKVKMQRWLKMPRPEFDNGSAVDLMLKGRARKVKNLLEQRAV